MAVHLLMVESLIVSERPHAVGLSRKPCQAVSFSWVGHFQIPDNQIMNNFRSEPSKVFKLRNRKKKYYYYKL